MASVKFDLPMVEHESECLRGAVIRSLSDCDNPLIHNHTDRDGGLRYAYPLVQYKSVDRKGTIIALNEGVDVVASLLTRPEFIVRMGARSVSTTVKSMNFDDFVPEMSSKGFRYRITRWQALNSEHYNTYRRLVALTDKIVYLEHLLLGHIIALYKGLGIRVEEEVQCCFTKLSEPYLVHYKQIDTTLFDVEIISNISLPVYAGLGKGASIGFGVIQEISNK